MRAVWPCSIIVTASAACLVSVDESRVVEPGAAGTADAGPDAARGEAGADASPYAGLACGAAHCTRTGQVCCATRFGDPDVANGTCATEDTCESGDWFACTSPRDCEAGGLGDVGCCARIVRGSFNVTACASTCEAPDVRLCDEAAPRCPAGEQCLPSTRFPGLRQCSPPL